DQLDRFGELETIADRWAAVAESLPAGAQLVLNADDPLIADLGREQTGVTYFGVEDDSVALPEMQHATDSKHCRTCGPASASEPIYLGHLGRYSCPSCGQERPAPTIAAEQITLDATRSASFTLRTPDGSAEATIPLPGLYNVYNALAASALCVRLGVSLADVVAGLRAVTAAFGRAETGRLPGAGLSILLVKNPAGAHESL